MDTLTEKPELEDLLPGEVTSPYMDWLTIKDVSRILDLSQQRTGFHVDNGRMTYIRTPLGRLFNPESVHRFAEEHKRDKMATQVRRT